MLDSFKVMSRLANSPALVNAAFRPLPCRPLASSSRRASEQAAASSSRRASEQAGSCRPLSPRSKSLNTVRSLSAPKNLPFKTSQIRMGCSW